MRRYRNVPPFQFLQGFEAAARLGNFSQAAHELGLSPSAVSHQMRLLEDRLGQTLFRRVGRHVSLTDAGRDYQRTVAQALDDLEGGYRRLEPYRKPGSVVIYAPRELASRWLLPRLPRLLHDCPGVCPWIDTSERPIDFAEMEVSLAILYAEAPPPNVEAVRLLGDEIAPVLSPSLEHFPITTDNLLALPRINSEHPVRWADWFGMIGAPIEDSGNGLDFSDRDVALAAAEQGLGIVLASLPMARQALASGGLVLPFKEAIVPPRAWWAVSTTTELAAQPTRETWQWLSAEAARSAS
jgi:LysR family glycine cleavage system transcriptional activator